MGENSLLIIGPTPIDGVGYGGETILVQNLLDYGYSHNYDIIHINTFRFKDNKVLNLLYFIVNFLVHIWRSDIVFYNASYNGAFFIYYYTAPFVLFLRKKLVFRKLGGFFVDQLETCSNYKRGQMISLMKKSHLLLFETRRIVSYMEDLLGDNVPIKWFPNSRMSQEKRKHSSYRKRFLFISHIYEEKGIDYLLRLSNELPNDYVIDIYGIIKDEKYTSEYFSDYRANFCGALKMEEVPAILKRYDCLIFPTFCRTEGYPGIIIEAYSVGLPVITTSIGGIPEIVEDGVTGLLIPPKDYNALKESVTGLTEEQYQRMSISALEFFNQNFNSDNINKKVFDLILNL